MVEDIRGSYLRQPNANDSRSKEFDFQEKLSQFQDHLRIMLESRDIPYAQLTWEEFLRQKFSGRIRVWAK